MQTRMYGFSQSSLGRSPTHNSSVRSSQSQNLGNLLGEQRTHAVLVDPPRIPNGKLDVLMAYARSSEAASTLAGFRCPTTSNNDVVWYFARPSMCQNPSTRVPPSAITNATSLYVPSDFQNKISQSEQRTIDCKACTKSRVS